MDRKEIKVEVKIDDETAVGKYSNFINISNTDEDFTVDFVYINPNPMPGFGKLVSRVILSPKNAKKMMMSLNNSIQVYEQNFGEIEIENIPSENENNNLQ